MTKPTDVNQTNIPIEHADCWTDSISNDGCVTIDQERTKSMKANVIEVSPLTIDCSFDRPEIFSQVVLLVTRMP
jgi:hypothetical protein